MTLLSRETPVSFENCLTSGSRRADPLRPAFAPAKEYAAEPHRHALRDHPERDAAELPGRRFDASEEDDLAGGRAALPRMVTWLRVSGRWWFGQADRTHYREAMTWPRVSGRRWQGQGGGGGVGFAAIEGVGEGPKGRDSAGVRTAGGSGDGRWGFPGV